MPNTELLGLMLILKEFSSTLLFKFPIKRNLSCSIFYTVNNLCIEFLFYIDIVVVNI